MEIDPNIGFNDLPDEYFDGENDIWRASRGAFQEFLGAFPGIDEAMSYAEGKPHLYIYRPSVVGPCPI